MCNTVCICFFFKRESITGYDYYLILCATLLMTGTGIKCKSSTVNGCYIDVSATLIMIVI